MTQWHFMEGEAGCRYAREHGAAAIVVDALRASATAAMLFDAGAVELYVVREIAEARAVKASAPDVLLAGERGGVRPDGFDLGNSPRETAMAAGRRVVFSTTTGAGRLVSAWGAHAVCFGTTINASAAVCFVQTFARDVVLIPAGLTADPHFDAQEDRAAAAYLGMLAGGVQGNGAALWRHWADRVERDGLERLFSQAPHAEKLRRVGMEADIVWCAQTDVTQCVPVCRERTEYGALVRDAGARGQ